MFENAARSGPSPHSRQFPWELHRLGAEGLAQRGKQRLGRGGL
jgi:hypothetical protein